MFFKKKAPVDVALARTALIRCSFCSKTESEVVKMIAGPSAYICNECVTVCTGILSEDRGSDAKTSVPDASAEAPSPDPGTTAFCAFCGRPIAWEDALLVPEQGAYCHACRADDQVPGA